MKRTLKRELKVLEIVTREPISATLGQVVQLFILDLAYLESFSLRDFYVRQSLREQCISAWLIIVSLDWRKSN